LEFGSFGAVDSVTEAAHLKAEVEGHADGTEEADVDVARTDVILVAESFVLDAGQSV
jgi:hypothetical protein